MQKWLLIVVTLPHSFLTFRRTGTGSCRAFLRTLQQQHFDASLAFVDAVPALEDAD
ncbi:hypothetical protein N5S81_23975 [Escherichia coli]|nr:hypothetical protein [Escherichia coli]MCW3239267.1 hypothetical protein [Escherichia coli]